MSHAAPPIFHTFIGRMLVECRAKTWQSLIGLHPRLRTMSAPLIPQCPLARRNNIGYEYPQSCLIQAARSVGVIVCALAESSSVYVSVSFELFTYKLDGGGSIANPILRCHRLGHHKVFSPTT